MDDLAGQEPQSLVTVVIPTYNRAEYIAETIQSVLDQTYRNLEIIVVDDGSTDDTRTVVEPFIDRIHYVWQENAERGAARNHGLRLASGKYIAFLDSDDLWLPNMAEECVRFMEANPRVGLVYTDGIQIDAEGRELRVVRANGPSGRVTDALLRNNLISIGQHLLRTDLAKEAGAFREERDLSGSEDFEFWVRLSLCTDFAYLPVATTKIRTHPANTMNNAAAMRRSMAHLMSLLRGSGEFAAIPRARLRRFEADLAMRNAINHCTQRDRRSTLRFLREAAATDPRVMFDPRYPYTIARLLIRSLGL